MQADDNGNRGQRQRHNELQVKQRIAHRRHHIRAYPQSCEEHQGRYRHRQDQGRQKKMADGALVRLVVSG
jgi:hypothetical protein